MSDERQQQALARGPGATPTVRVRPGRDGRHFLRVLIAPGAFKESLTADAAAAAMQRGVQNAARRLGAAIFTDLCPVADGGDGFVRALVGATGGELRTDRVTGPLGEPVDAEWGVLSGQAPERADVPVGQVARRAVETALDLPSGALARSPKPLQPWKTAVLEAATCTGLALVPAGQRNPARTTTFGLGELISHALDAGCGRIIVGLGGSATIDGGLGVARALGVRLTDSAGRPLTSPDRPHPVGDDLARLAHLAVNTRDDRLDHVRVTVAADVGIPLLGPGGAARVFGPQKGASPEQIELLESGLATLAARCAQAGLSADPESPGAGAAGGLGFGLSAMLDATIQPGAGLVLEAVRFASRARQADIVLTGEGRLDSTTTSGKLVHAVATAARDAGAMPIALVGALGDGADAAAAAAGIQAYRAITPPGAPAEEAMRFAADLLEAETERTIRAALTSDPR